LTHCLDRYPGFAEFIEAAPDEAAFERLRRADSIGRPNYGDSAFYRPPLLKPSTVAISKIFLHSGFFGHIIGAVELAEGPYVDRKTAHFRG